MDNTCLQVGRHRLPVHPIVRTRQVLRIKKTEEYIIDKPMIRPVIKATDLRALFGDNELPVKRSKHRQKENYKIDHREISWHGKRPIAEQRVIEVPGEDLRVKFPLGVVCYRVEHRGFEYLLYLNSDTGALKYFEKRFL